MAKAIDKTKEALNNIENKGHEAKGKIEQKRKDMSKK